MKTKNKKRRYCERQPMAQRVRCRLSNDGRPHNKSVTVLRAHINARINNNTKNVAVCRTITRSKRALCRHACFSSLMGEGRKILRAQSARRNEN